MKEQDIFAGEYALNNLAKEWHPIIKDTSNISTGIKVTSEMEYVKNDQVFKVHN